MKVIKKILNIALCLALVMSYVPMVSLTAFAEDTATSAPYSGTPADSFTAGAGTEASPYEIDTEEELYYFASLVNNGNTGIHAKLTANIVVNPGTFDADGNYTPKDGESVRDWTPIGSSSRRYTGTFDGDGHTISGLYYNSSTNYVGLVGYVGSGGKVQNVGVIGSYFRGEVGVSEFTLENVEKTGSLEYIIAGESAAFEFIALSDWQ